MGSFPLEFLPNFCRGFQIRPVEGQKPVLFHPGPQPHWAHDRVLWSHPAAQVFTAGRAFRQGHIWRASPQPFLVVRGPVQSLRGDAGTSTGVFCLWRFHQRGGSAGCQQETPGQMPAGTEPAKCQRSHHALSHHWSLSAIVLINLETN